MDEERVVLVDAAGAVTGTREKHAAHEAPGVLHLAFSTFLYRPDGTMLLQRRAASKYHFPLAWANACCSHPRPGEDVVSAAARRVREELGIDCAPSWVGSFTYRARCDLSGLVEHELDHVLIATTEVEARPDPAEVAEVAWVDPAVLLAGTAGFELAPWCLPGLRIAEAARAARS